MAAYTALVSLTNTLYNIQIHPRVSTFVYKKQIESLSSKVDSLLDFETNLSSRGGIEEAEDLESQIASAAYAAEDLIESRIMDLIESGSTETSSSFPIDLQKIIEEVDSLVEKMKKVKEEGRIEDQQPTYSNSSAKSRSPPTTGKTTMVGFDGYLIQLLDSLTGQESNRHIIPIVGMAGIGKTTLARNAYENLLTVENFDLRAWVTVSQQYSVRGILIQTLSSVEGFPKEDDEIDELGEKLYKTLYARRYVVILDDMWSIEAWEKVQSYFPENFNRSRIVVTTRQSEVSSYFRSGALAPDFLDDDTSWELFCEQVFAQEGCPPYLEAIGKKIVKKCRGLPLAIVVIGGLLGKFSETHEYWEFVEKDLSSILSSEMDNQCFDILSLSYSHLPLHLKPCFLYLGIFPEDHEIRVSKLIKLWVAEGLIPNKLNEGQSLEEVAEGYVKDLLDRNLILVRELSRRGKLKSVSIHDLLRDLCINVAAKEKFFCVIKELDAPLDMDSDRRIVIQESFEKEDDIRVSMKSARTVIGQRMRGFLVKPRLLRVMSDACGSTLDVAFQQLNLRFLQIHYVGQCVQLSSTICPLWNLQTLVLAGFEVFAPPEFWEMPQLRHFSCDLLYLPDPPRSDKQDSIVLRNLQTLGLVQRFGCSVEVYSRMPNIKKLQITYEYYCYKEDDQETSFSRRYNFGCLNKLDSLQLFCDSLSYSNEFLHNLTFPKSLKKLTLGYCKLHWDHLTVIGSLPHLEVLKLDRSFRGNVWNPVEGNFSCLKFLSIFGDGTYDLVTWNADRYHFPVLEKLILSHVSKLEEIPKGIGDIYTLEDISLYGCGVSSAISALRIVEEQQSLGNEGLQVRVKFWRRTSLEEFKKQAEVELRDLPFPRPNFYISCRG